MVLDAQMAFMEDWAARVGAEASRWRDLSRKGKGAWTAAAFREVLAVARGRQATLVAGRRSPDVAQEATASTIARTLDHDATALSPMRRILRLSRPDQIWRRVKVRGAGPSPPQRGQGGQPADSGRGEQIW